MHKEHPLLPFPDHPSFPPRVRERLKTVGITAMRNAEAVNDRARAFLDTFDKRLTAVVRSRGPVQSRLRALYRLLDELMAFNGTNAACKRGCSHCCHVGVSIFEAEARMIGKQIGIKPMNAKHRPVINDFDYGYHNPCTFLVNGECSIYEHRPFACRTLINMDQDALLCELHPPLSIPVPYLDTRRLWDAYIAICYPGRAAELRDYFPRGKDGGRPTGSASL